MCGDVLFFNNIAVNHLHMLWACKPRVCKRYCSALSGCLSHFAHCFNW